jgi:perosamine synthetase
MSNAERRILVSGPSITQKEIDYVTDAVSSAWYENANVYNIKFEQAFAAYIGVKYAIALPSCTSAIHLSLLALGIEDGDEVIVPDLTWIATAAPLHYVGAKPIFADVDEKTWCISADSIKSKITEKTKAIIVVDLYGNMPAMHEIRQIADEFGLKIIEDAAEAIGSEYQGSKAGSFGDTGVFSFHGSKTLTTGEGGMLVTNDESVYKRSLFLRDHGRKPGDKLFWNTEIAYKYKMSSMQAALGLAQLERIEELVDKKRQIFSWYQDELQHVNGITLNHEENGTKNTFWMNTIIIDKKYNLDKERVIELLSDMNIETRPIFHPLSALPAYSDLIDAQIIDNPVTYAIAPYGINLPSGMNLTRTDIQYIADCVKNILAATSQV